MVPVRDSISTIFALGWPHACRGLFVWGSGLSVNYGLDDASLTRLQLDALDG
jgi:hypothetical protein